MGVDCRSVAKTICQYAMNCDSWALAAASVFLGLFGVFLTPAMRTAAAKSKIQNEELQIVTQQTTTTIFTSLLHL